MSSAASEKKEDDDVKKHIHSSDDWGTSMFQDSALSAKVTQFQFVAHENRSNVGDKIGSKTLPATNHWSLFLTTSSTSSIRLEVAPNDPGKPGMVLLENKKYDVSTKITKKVSINAPSNLTVGHVLDLIIQKKRDHYKFAIEGEGCRFWLYTLASDFAAVKMISETSAHEVQAALVKYWPYPTGTAAVDRPMAKGEFPKSAH